MFRGTLPGGLSGSLALYTYEETSRDSKGRNDDMNRVRQVFSPSEAAVVTRRLLDEATE